MIAYSSAIFIGIISKLYSKQGTSTINAITIGSNIVQLNNINWSNLIRGKDALTQIKVNIIIEDFTPKFIPYNIPSIKGLEKNSILLLKV